MKAVRYVASAGSGHWRRWAALACVALLVAACGKPPPPPDPAARDLSIYRQLVASQSWTLASSQGAELVRKFPGSAAAIEVQKSLGEVTAKSKAQNNAKRLAALWSYQTGPQSGGMQHTAALDSSKPATDDKRVRLILRRHTDWGQSTYLFAQKPGFACAKPCTVSITFDGGSPESWAAHPPETGEPALFIDEDVKFISRLEAANEIVFEVTRKGGTPEQLLFEVGGYDGGQLPQLAKK